MSAQDIVLSIDLAPEDCLYRILRKNPERVVYVNLEHLDLIPEESRTYGPDVIRELSKLPEWNNGWKTLTISKENTGIRSQRDIFEPHALPQAQVHDLYERFNILTLEEVQSVKSRVSHFQNQDTQYFLKIARFGFEMPSLAKEAEVYDILTREASTLAPRLLGYAYEPELEDDRITGRVIGLVLEAVSGRHPGISDLGTCQEALQQLHGLGIIHGDINKYNIFLTKDGAKFIDFEESGISSVDESKKAKEMQSLYERLLDESGTGRPW
ncbi:hypothetical protein FZEAL_6718 [Fusarium zealandicum]|uniref:Alpha-galactosidase A n=1 Tax=Fusarium zealandicum TaxID=1053134 RepID=A0A8H4UI17_9HYPO|nr:hypothetical protein FZEAL_6718 [Fusarium zealandicum]